MNRRLKTRQALLRLARFRELAATQRLAESLAVRNEAQATQQVEQGEYAALSARYAQAATPGRTLHLARYEVIGTLRRSGEIRLESAMARVEETSAVVEAASTRLIDASERRSTHEERLAKLEDQLRAEATAREQSQFLETWMLARSKP